MLDIGFVGKDASLHGEMRRRHPEKFFTGLDLSPRVLSLRISGTVMGDCFALPFKKACFNTVILGEVLEHHFNAYDILKQASAVLRKNGVLLVTTPNPYSVSRWLKAWFFSFPLQKEKNIRYFLGDSDHKVFWEPLSLANMLASLGFKINELVTVTHRIPFLGRVSRIFQDINLNFFPFNRVGGYLCIRAVKQ